MNPSQFRALYREFLFRIVDRELLAAHADGDASKLLGRLAAFLLWLSTPFALMAFGIQGSADRTALLVSALRSEHALISTTMLIVGLLAVLSWDSLFPDRRDVFVLGALPVRGTTVMRAKAASLAAALGTSVAVFNALPSVGFLLALQPASDTLLDLLFSIQTYRTLLAYWIVVTLAGGFVLGGVVSLQAIIAQLPRAWSLRVSSAFQVLTLCTLVSIYFLQPSLPRPEQLPAAAGHSLRFLPSYWFLGLFQQLNGLPDSPVAPALRALAARAGLAILIVCLGAVSGFLLTNTRTLRKIVEEPDLVPTRHRRSFLMPFGSPQKTAIVHFAVRTLFRSRQHRVLLAFAVGLGFSITMLFLGTPFLQKFSRSAPARLESAISLAAIGSSFVLTCCWIFGLRVAFAIPVELRAHWVFQLALSTRGNVGLSATRAALYGIGLGPCCGLAAVLFVWHWPLLPAVQHCLVLSLFGFALCTLCLTGFHKLPFTCSYLPGRSNLHITLVLCLLLGLNLTFWLAFYERQALYDAKKYLWFLTSFAVAAALAWWRMQREAAGEHISLVFTEEAAPALMSLGLQRDGTMPIRFSEGSTRRS